MRKLAEPSVVKCAAIAAMLTSLASFPRLTLWPERPLPLWYLEATIFAGGFVLWAFVFAWHTEHTGRPIITFQIPSRDIAITTAAGVVFAAVLRLSLDPILRVRTPQDYPSDLIEWIAKTLFSVAFLQLFLTLAPFAWLVRLFKNPKVAFLLTIAFGVVVLALKHERSPDPAPAPLFAALIVARIALSSITLWLYLRRGLILSSMWAVLIEARNLIGIVP